VEKARLEKMLAHEEIRTMISALGTGIGADEFDADKCRYGKIILMTDADVDGAHIRTLLLTFLFRQMPQLLVRRMVYIAQPPLYEIRVKGQKKSEYVLSEAQMRRRMIARGLEGTELLIRDGRAGGKRRAKSPARGGSRRANSQPMRKVSGKELAALVKALADVERVQAVLARRGVNFTEFMEAYYDGKRLPRFLIRVQGEEEVYYDNTKYEKRLDKLVPRGPGARDTSDQARGVGDDVVAEELHEVARINQINERLKAELGLDLSDFLLKPGKSASGEALPTKFCLIRPGGPEADYDVASLADICPAIRQIGGRGIEIKRFKGLGEMNAEQLWETTMNPATRTLLSVRLDDAGEADRLFSILMGDDVDKRRSFIQEHALEVQNLDV